MAAIRRIPAVEMSRRTGQIDRGRGETRHATWVCAGIVLGFDQLVMLCTAPAARRTRSAALPASLRTAMASDDLRGCQRVGDEAGPDLGARGGFVERQRWDLERV
jgi:hypothetical protein